MIRFIDEYRDRFSVEFICETLNTHRVGGFITSRGYRQSKARGMSARSLRDAALVAHIAEVHEENFGVYGIRKMWHTLRREGCLLYTSPSPRDKRQSRMPSSA